MNILFKLKKEFTATHGFIYDDRYFDIENILFFIEESEIEYRALIAIAVLMKFYAIQSLSSNNISLQLHYTYKYYVFNEVSLNDQIYKNVFSKFFEYRYIANESDLENDFKPYIKVSKNNNCYHGIHTDQE
jgi:hypothetical protein